MLLFLLALCDRWSRVSTIAVCCLRTMLTFVLGEYML